MQTSEHYSLNLAEGTDLVNPLTIDVPNYEAIDTGMYANRQNIVSSATELKSGTTHAITRSNTDSPIFRFVATSNYTEGDLFTVDGVSVTPTLVSGETLPTGAYVINQVVVACLNGTSLTLYLNTVSKDRIDTLNNTVNSISGALSALSTTISQHTTQISSLNSRLNVKSATVNNTNAGYVTLSKPANKIIGASVSNWNNCYVTVGTAADSINAILQVRSTSSSNLVADNRIIITYYYID